MQRYIFGWLIILLLIIGCKEASKPIESIPSMNTKDEAPFKRAFSDGDYNFQLEYNNRLDTSYFDVLYKGKEVSRLGFKGKIKDEFVADLNNDKKKEVYIVVEHEHRSNIFAYLIEEGRSVEIKKEEHRSLSKIKSTTYKIERNQLVERFKFLSSDEKMENKELRYNLIKKENEYVLLPQGWSPFELEKMTGQYVARDAQKVGYYKVMFLRQNSVGEWNVDIKVKRNEDKKILCDFNGNGYFIDRDLMVPLNSVNPNLKGTLQIRFLDLLAVVYTEDPSDSKEMISFCGSEGSIAGNFKKTNI